jgi:hypothetical protein
MHTTMLCYVITSQVKVQLILKCISRISIKDRMRNEELRRSGIEDAGKAARRLKWRWGEDIWPG